MANYATNIFFASTENENDLNKIEKYLNETFYDCYLERWDECIDGEFESRWDYPEELMNKLFDQLEEKDKLYCRVLTHELANEYVSFRMFTNGEWDIRY